MSEVGIRDVTNEQSLGSPDATLTAGQMMRNARESAGLHVAALAVSMKIPVKKLEALEADRLDLLHDAVFVRALASSVCRSLKIDPAPVLNKLPVTTTPRLGSYERGINAPFRPAGEAAGVSVAALLSRPPVLIVIALLIAAAVVVFFPNIKVTEASVEMTGSATAPGSSEGQPDMESFAPVVAAPTSVSQPVLPKSVPAVAEQMAGGSVKVASVAAEVVRSASIPLTSSTGLVVFKARAASWVKVVDSKGVVQLSKTLDVGEVAGASGATPLSVVVGRADMTDVEVRGKTFSTEGLVKENVARFEVK